MKPSLNEPQSRSIKNVLMEMERLLHRSRALRENVSCPDEPGVLIHSHAALSEPQMRALETFEDKTQEQLILLRDTFELEAVEEDLGAQLLSAFSLLWANLEDARPKRMTGYGEFDPEAAAVLEQVIGELVELCRDIVDVLENKEA